MKLILSSCDFHNENSRNCILENLPKRIENCRVLFIPNEKASKKAIRSEKFYERLKEYGFARDNILVFDYYDAASFFNLDIDVIYISGGNTFQTFDRIKKRDFDTEIIKYIKNGVTYIGGSAGAHIVSKNIEHVLNYDENTANMSNFSALAMTKNIFICHFDESRKPHLDALRAKGEYNVIALTNDQSVVITSAEDGNESVIYC